MLQQRWRSCCSQKPLQGGTETPRQAHFKNSSSPPTPMTQHLKPYNQQIGAAGFVRHTMARVLLLCLLVAQGIAGSIFVSASATGRQLKQITEDKCYHGCFADAYALRAVKRFLYKQDQAMNVEDCHGAAIQKGYPYFAVQFGRECWATKGYNRAVQYGVSDGCNYTCPGNTNETCGGWLAFQFYSRGACLPPPPAPSPSPPPPPEAQPPYKFSMVFLNSTVKYCRPTNDTLWANIVEPLGAHNNSICRCDVGSVSPTTPQSITVSTRFNSADDLHALVNDVKDLSTGHAAALLAASHIACSNSPKDTKMSMLLVDPTPADPKHQVGVYFVCNNTALPASTSAFTYIGASFRCCSIV